MIARMGKKRIVICAVLILVACVALTVIAIGLNLPEASGKTVKKDGKLTIDCSHMDQGYIMCCVSAPTSHRLKVRMTYATGAQLDYDLDNDGDYVVFPLQLGSGNYEFSLFENVKGTKYSAEGKITLSAQLSDENAAFLVPNQYVNYVPETEAVLM